MEQKELLWALRHLRVQTGSGEFFERKKDCGKSTAVSSFFYDGEKAT